MKGKWFRVLPLGVALFGLGTVLLTGGCSSSSAHFRYVQGSPGAPTNVDVEINSKTVLTNIGYGQSASYQSTRSGSHQVQIFETGTTTNPVFSGSVTFNSGYTTLITENFFSQIALAPYTDDNSVPTSGNIRLRLINAAPSAGTVDVYVVTPPGNGITGISPNISALAYQQASGDVGKSYLSIAAGSYDVVFTQTGTQNIISQLSNQSFTAGQVRTVVMLDASSGGAPFDDLVLDDLN
jgi:hypothetical protein